MRVTGDDWAVEGDAIDCRERAIGVRALFDAVRRDPLEETSAAVDEPAAKAGTTATVKTETAKTNTAKTAATGTDPPVRVACERPGPVNEHVGLVTTSTTLRLRAALAATARARGIEPDALADLEAARESLASVEIPEVDVAEARERVAAARAAEEAVHADVAAARGAVGAREDLDADADAARERLQAAVAAASERETERIAAEQALERAREQARAARDARSRRLELADRVGRLEREVRTARVDAVWDAFASAIDAVPWQRSGDGTPACEAERAVPGDVPGTDESDDATAALAIARIAPLSAPVVLAAGRFERPEHARDVLDAPVILASPPD